MSGVIVGIETGGEHIVVGTARLDAPFALTSRWECKTASPEDTMKMIGEHIRTIDNIRAVGIAAFGPLDIEKGLVTSTPKLEWTNTPIVEMLREYLPEGVQIAMDTDVNAAALAEWNARDGKVKNLAYITVGTGVGAGVIVENQEVHGMLHPEVGHLFVAPAPGDTFQGTCPYHKTCIEGMAASRALAGRFDVVRENLSSVRDDNPQWAFVAHYLASACAALILTVSPQIIVFGGGILKRKILFPMIHKMLMQQLAGYISIPQVTDPEMIKRYIVPAALGDNSGVLGAILIADRALKAA